MFGNEQTECFSMFILTASCRGFLMTNALTPSQISILRRIDSGMGLPAYLLRPKNCATDVETLCAGGLLELKYGEPSITVQGSSRLRRIDVEQEDSEFDAHHLHTVAVR
jgi:hypothetical protein